MKDNDIQSQEVTQEDFKLKLLLDKIEDLLYELLDTIRKKRIDLLKTKLIEGGLDEAYDRYFYFLEKIEKIAKEDIVKLKKTKKINRKTTYADSFEEKLQLLILLKALSDVQETAIKMLEKEEVIFNCNKIGAVVVFPDYNVNDIDDKMTIFNKIYADVTSRYAKKKVKIKVAKR